MGTQALPSLRPRALRDRRPLLVRLPPAVQLWRLAARAQQHRAAHSAAPPLAERSKAAKHKSVGQRAAKREFKAPGADSLIAQRLTSKEVCQADYYHLAELMVPHFEHVLCTWMGHTCSAQLP